MVDENLNFGFKKCSVIALKELTISQGRQSCLCMSIQCLKSGILGNWQGPGDTGWVTWEPRSGALGTGKRSSQAGLERVGVAREVAILL